MELPPQALLLPLLCIADLDQVQGAGLPCSERDSRQGRENWPRRQATGQRQRPDRDHAR